MNNKLYGVMTSNLYYGIKFSESQIDRFIDICNAFVSVEPQLGTLAFYDLGEGEYGYSFGNGDMHLLVDGEYVIFDSHTFTYCTINEPLLRTLFTKSMDYNAGVVCNLKPRRQFQEFYDCGLATGLDVNSLRESEVFKRCLPIMKGGKLFVIYPKDFTNFNRKIDPKIDGTLIGKQPNGWTHFSICQELFNILYYSISEETYLSVGDIPYMKAYCRERYSTERYGQIVPISGIEGSWATNGKSFSDAGAIMCDITSNLKASDGVTIGNNINEGIAEGIVNSGFQESIAEYINRKFDMIELDRKGW